MPDLAVGVSSLMVFDVSMFLSYLLWFEAWYCHITMHLVVFFMNLQKSRSWRFEALKNSKKGIQIRKVGRNKACLANSWPKMGHFPLGGGTLNSAVLHSAAPQLDCAKRLAEACILQNGGEA